jgi:beta-lactamase regulating signal transducer with metallopeptidase domain
MIISNLIPALGWTLLHSLWQGGLLFLLALPLFHLLKNRPPQLRYAIACTTLLLLLASMAWTFSTQLEYSDSGTAVESALQPAVPNAIDVGGPIMPTAMTSEEAVSSLPASSTVTPFSLSQFLEANVVYLVAIWGLGVLLFTFRWCHMLLLTFRLRKRGTQNLPQVWHERLLRLKQRIGVERMIGLVESNQIDTPLVIGHFKPIILLPIGLVNGLTVVQVEAILAHEIAHVGRHDFLVNLFLSGLEVVLFYHPVYWWLAGRINQEREKCCDDVAVAACGNRRMYARTLLSVEEHRQSGVLAMAFAKEGGQLQNRIQRICQVTPRRHQSLSLRFWFLLPLLGCAVAFAYAGVSPIIPENDVLESPDLIYQEVDSSPDISVVEAPVEQNTLAPAPIETPVATVEENTSAVSSLPLTEIDEPESTQAPEPRVPGIEVSVPDVSPATYDSLPKPTIPQMTSNPTLPTPPSFRLSEKEIKDLLTKGDEGRKQLRDQTDAHRAKIRDWNDRVREEYLQPWDAHRVRIMDAYKDWNDGLRAQSADELTYALAHNRMTEVFERAFDQNENIIEEAEDAIEHRPEYDTEGLEHVIERGEKSVKDHSDRMEVHSIRMSMHSVRMAIHSGRMNVHTGRMKMHSSRMELHSERMKSHQIIMTALEAELRAALMADGLLSKSDKYFRFEVTIDDVIFNGKVIEPASREQKYRAILKRYGKGDLGGNKGNTFMINIHENGRQIGTHHRKN